MNKPNAAGWRPEMTAAEGDKPKRASLPKNRPPASIVDYLRRGSKIEVRPMAMPALSATHTKMIIIDGSRGWLGGMNIGREYRSDWHDMMVEVRGPLAHRMRCVNTCMATT